MAWPHSSLRQIARMGKSAEGAARKTGLLIRTTHAPNLRDVAQHRSTPSSVSDRTPAHFGGSGLLIQDGIRLGFVALLGGQLRGACISMTALHTW